MARVVILQELIAEQVEKSGTKLNREALRFAAMAHDVGRRDDGTDPQHGRRSAEWMRVHLASMMTPEVLDVATYIVEWHVPADSEAPVMTTELQILKDADGLDRVRLGDLNPAYLRTMAANKLIEIAQLLYEYSLPVRPVVQPETFADVVRAAKMIGVVQ